MMLGPGVDGSYMSVLDAFMAAQGLVPSQPFPAATWYCFVDFGLTCFHCASQKLIMYDVTFVDSHSLLYSANLLKVWGAF